MSKKILKKNVDYIVERITNVIDTFGPREPGSLAESLAQDYVKKELADCCDDIKVEDFELHPKAFMGFVPVTGSLMMAAVAAYHKLPALSAPLSLLGISVAGLEFLKYKKFIDPFFPKKTSKNVLGIRKAEGEVKRCVIVSGHIDAAYEWRYSYLGGPVLMKVVIGSSIIAALTKTGIDIASLLFRGFNPGIPEGKWKTLGRIQLIALPLFASMLFLSNFKVTVDGANDNLTGTFTAIAAMKYLEELNIRYADTEVCCLITGSEEAGLRGAKAFVKKHSAELKEVETVFLALENFRDIEHMAVYNRDMSGTVKNDPEASELLQKAASLCGMDIPMASIYLGSSDAAAFSEAGVPATALAAMDPAPPDYYHTRLDSKDNLAPDCIEKGLEITLKFIDLYASQEVGSC